MGIAAVLIALLAWGIYFYRTLGQLRYVRYPVESYALGGLAVVLGAFPGGWPLWLSLGLLAVFVYWTATYSNMPGKPVAVRIGAPAPDFTLPDARGNAVQLLSFRGRKNVLLMFYRGHW